MKQYMIISKEDGAFYTDYFEVENHYVDGLIVVDFINQVVMFERGEWEDIEEDHL